MGTTAHSDDLRSRVVAEILAGASRRQAAERFKVSAASAVRWAQLYSQTGGVGPRPRGGKSRSPLEPHAAWLLDLTTAEPDLTLEAIVQRLLASLGLVPTLSRGDTVIIDNLSSHKVTGVREAIEAVGAGLIYLPPYSPDLNPIELAFAKFKTGLRKAAERTVDDLWRRIGVLIHDFSPQECQNYFCHDGYASS